jgi:hypothetical protein
VSLSGYGTITWLAHQLDTFVPQGVDGSKPGYAMFVPSMVAITHEAWLRTPTTIVV